LREALLYMLELAAEWEGRTPYEWSVNQLPSSLRTKQTLEKVINDLLLHRDRREEHSDQLRSLDFADLVVKEAQALGILNDPSQRAAAKEAAVLQLKGWRSRESIHALEGKEESLLATASAAKKRGESAREAVREHLAKILGISERTLRNLARAARSSSGPGAVKTSEHVEVLAYDMPPSKLHLRGYVDEILATHDPLSHRPKGK
jgi:hypothetical protein